MKTYINYMFQKNCLKKTVTFELRRWLIAQYFKRMGMEMSVVLRPDRCCVSVCMSVYMHRNKNGFVTKPYRLTKRSPNATMLPVFNKGK